jgi:putative hydrolase of the HAD superfamily
MRKALLFDYDGVIVDSEAAVGRAFIDVLAQDGVDVSFGDFGHLLGTTGPDSDERWKRFISDLVGPSAVLEEVERKMTPAVRLAYDELAVLPGVRELVDAAREAGWAIGLGTGNTGPLDQYLERLGLSSVFDAVVRTHGSGLASKPAPDVFLTLAEELGASPERCVVVEDSVPGCEAAIAAGMAVILCPTIATAGCTFPEGPVRCASLTEITIEQLEMMVDANPGGIDGRRAL